MSDKIEAGLEARGEGCCSSSCGCGPSRREAMFVLGAAAVGVLMNSRNAMAGPFTREDFDQLVPADKKLKPEWIKSLYERGTPETYRGEELKYIGMPIGGICAGQLYLGGDGKLWLWDIFNKQVKTTQAYYAKPRTPEALLEQGFTLTLASDNKPRALDQSGFAEVSFTGQYPIATVDYRDPSCPVQVSMEAFTPFIPLNTDDSSLPATVFRFTLKNTGSQKVDLTLAGHLENIIAGSGGAMRRSAVKRTPAATILELSASSDPQAANRPVREDILFEDFNKETYEGWTATGSAFGNGPVNVADLPKYMGKVNAPGKRMVSSHATAPGKSVNEKDDANGTLTSKPFKIERNFIRFFIGGGDKPGLECLNLIVDGKIAHSATGKNSNQLRAEVFDVRSLQGRTAQLQIVDNAKGAWANVGVAHIVFTDKSNHEHGKVEDRPDFGTMTLALLEPRDGDEASPADVMEVGSNEKLRAAVARKLSLASGESATVGFAITWHFPNLVIDKKQPGLSGRYYAAKFESATTAAEYLSNNYGRLYEQTRLWRDTWYDSTLPHWFLNRTFLNTSILASSTCYRFKDGRFYAWEGVGCCAGTCTHVWHYAHAPARLFPELERILRERVDFDLAMKPDGSIRFRGEFNGSPAVDGQAGSILRAYREHQMSADDAFLKRNWPAIKKATQWLITKDSDGDGIIVGNQHNTLDADWFGPVAWLSGLYLAALRAAEAMALELGDNDFASRCRAIFDVGTKKIVADLFDGDYFINKPDPKHPDAINSGTGCEIDQVFGQSWAFQVGLGRVLPEKETRTALQSLWRYNFSPDVGPYREKNTPGRWYAMPGEAGLLMCSFPRKDWDYHKAAGKGPDWAAGYFNECMNGFEYQVAGHMIWEGMVQEGLAVTRAVHDRYGASRRNPYNEIECGDHYARSMASYGVFLAACGFEYHGPKGYMAFAPRLTPENFKAPFTSAESWGSFSQKRDGNSLKANLNVAWGSLRLKTLALALPEGVQGKSIRVTCAGKDIPATSSQDGNRLGIAFAGEQVIQQNQELTITIE